MANKFIICIGDEYERMFQRHCWSFIFMWNPRTKLIDEEKNLKKLLPWILNMVFTIPIIIIGSNALLILKHMIAPDFLFRISVFNIFCFTCTILLAIFVEHVGLLFLALGKQSLNGLQEMRHIEANLLEHLEIKGRSYTAYAVGVKIFMRMMFMTFGMLTVGFVLFELDSLKYFFDGFAVLMPIENSIIFYLLRLLALAIRLSVAFIQFCETSRGLYVIVFAFLSALLLMNNCLTELLRYTKKHLRSKMDKKEQMTTHMDTLHPLLQFHQHLHLAILQVIKLQEIGTFFGLFLCLLFFGAFACITFKMSGILPLFIYPIGPLGILLVFAIVHGLFPLAHRVNDISMDLLHRWGQFARANLTGVTRKYYTRKLKATQSLRLAVGMPYFTFCPLKQSTKCQFYDVIANSTVSMLIAWSEENMLSLAF